MAQETSEPIAGGCGGGWNGDLGKGPNPRRELEQKVRQIEAQQCQTACESYSDPRRIVERLIDYHNRQANELHALLRALPAEMNHQAEKALYRLAVSALGSIR